MPSASAKIGGAVLNDGRRVSFFGFGVAGHGLGEILVKGPRNWTMDGMLARLIAARAETGVDAIYEGGIMARFELE
jgi:hypothetical protein